MPSFLIVGAQKAGTTSMFGYLRQHPELLSSLRKEVLFFDGGAHPDVDNFARGEAWYRANFPPRKRLTGRRKTFEASPNYMFNPLVPKRIHDFVPSVRIIVLLRDPTERAISQYFHEVRWNQEHLSIEEALAAEEKRLESLQRERDYKSKAYIHHSYRSRGLYEVQLRRYFDWFPREHILILGSEEFFRQPAETLKRVFHFVEVDETFEVPDLNARNVNKKKLPVDLKVYRDLNEFFSPHNQALFQLIGQDFDWRQTV